MTLVRAVRPPPSGQRVSSLNDPSLIWIRLTSYVWAQFTNCHLVATNLFSLKVLLPFWQADGSLVRSIGTTQESPFPDVTYSTKFVEWWYKLYHGQSDAPKACTGCQYEDAPRSVRLVKRLFQYCALHRSRDIRFRQRASISRVFFGEEHQSQSRMIDLYLLQLGFRH